MNNAPVRHFRSDLGVSYLFASLGCFEICVSSFGLWFCAKILLLNSQRG